MLRPLDMDDNGNIIVLTCQHAGVWPPPHAYMGQSPEQVLADGHYNDVAYQGAKTWERVCGLRRMSADKCLTCPLSRRSDGKSTLPVERTSTAPMYRRLKRVSRK